MRALADEILPGAVVKRHLLWRYSLVYQKPPQITQNNQSA